MKFKDFMMKSLTDMLEEGENLSCPFYGILNQGNSQFFGYFGLTQTHLLVALVSEFGNRITYTTRIPLDIKSVKSKQTAILKQYIIDISFNDGPPCRITASPKVLSIGSQKENLLDFIAVLDKNSSQSQQIELKDSDGDKIRYQYFNVVIYAGLFIAYMVIVLLAAAALATKSFSFADIFIAIPLIITFLSPFIILSLLNRFLFGKIVCVICDEGLILENDIIPWNNIKKISFEPNSAFLTRRSRNVKYTCATVDVKTNESEEYSIDILHFPRYGLKRIKKQHPEIEIDWGIKRLLKLVAFGLSIPLISIAIVLIKLATVNF